MTTDSFFALMLGAMIALFFGFLLTIAGYRFFTFLLPILGFFFGFAFGAQTIRVAFGEAPMATITSWATGFFFAMVFAAMAYLFYVLAVAIAAGALGFAVGAGLTQAIGFDLQFMVWIVGVVAGIALAFAAIYFNIQKWVVIISTAVLGAATIVGTFLFMFGGLPPAETVENPVRAALQGSPLWTITFAIIAAIGVIVQYQTTRGWEVEVYKRLTGTTGSSGAAKPAVGETGELSTAA